MSTDPSDRAALEREIRARQQSLASTVDELADRVAPKALAQRTAAGAQVKAREVAATAQTKARTAVLDEDGAVRVERVAVAGGAVLALLGAVIWRKSR